MSYTKLLVSVEEGVGIISLNNPPVNALSRAVLDDLGRALSAFQADPAVRAIVLTAEGALFAAGADIKEIAGIADAAGGERLSREGGVLLARLEQSPIPVIAAINGPCLGGGNELAMACPLRLASERARFGQPEILIGIIPGLGGTQRLPRIVGQSAALEMLLTGDPISAAQAKAIGLVSQVVPEQELRRAAVGLARRIGAQSKAAVAAILKAVREGSDLPLQAALELEARAFGASMMTADKKEGLAAFLEKRRPKFTDR